MINVIHGEIWSEDFSQLDKLAHDFSSCVRFCFARFQKDHNEFNDARNLAKWQYKTLNVRQVSDAVVQAQGLYTLFGQQKVIFGSKNLWKKLKSGLITKEEWDMHKNGQIYARGDAIQFGNPILRVVGKTLRVTVGKQQFVSYKLFIPEKFNNGLQNLIASGIAYNVRLIKKDPKHYRVIIDYQIDDKLLPIRIDFENGAIGVDTNPDRIAVCEVSKNGNYVKSFSKINTKIHFASTNKREHEIALLVKDVICYSQQLDKGIVFENLKFKKDFDSNRRFNRMRSNFAYRKFLELLERKCIEFGIEYRKVNPAYTSIIGKLKYKDLYKINIHESAAFVIARRGLGFNEKLSLKGYNHKQVKEQVFSILRTRVGKYKGKEKKRVHSWSLWKCLKDNTKVVLTGLSRNLPDLKELGDLSIFDSLDDEGGNPSGKNFLQELIVGSKNRNVLQGEERLPSKLLNFD